MFKIKSGAIVACFALISLVNPKSEFYIFPIPFAVEAQNVILQWKWIEIPSSLKNWILNWIFFLVIQNFSCIRFDFFTFGIKKARPRCSFGRCSLWLVSTLDSSILCFYLFFKINCLYLNICSLFFSHGPVFLNKFQGYVLSEWKKIRSS